MSFLARLFGRRGGEEEEEGVRGAAGPDEGLADEAEASPETGQQAVTAWVRLVDAEFTQEREQWRTFALEDRVMRVLHASGAGTYETNDLERGYFRMHMYGADAERIVEVVAPVLAEAPPGSYLAKRAGPPGTSEERVELG